MRLSELLRGTALLNAGDLTDTGITGVETDSRNVRPGSLFVCLRGINVDGHDFIEQAVNAGAAAVLCEAVPDGAPAAVYVLTEDTRAALAVIIGNLYGNSADRLSLIGVTGTKGKTSTTYFIRQILDHAGRKTGVIGTTGAFIGGTQVNVEYQTSSTPDLPDLYKILDEMAKKGASHAVMEVSSHGLIQRRTEGLFYTLGIFTNITHDHLDYHKSFDNYIRAKSLLFGQSELAIVNRDDPNVQKLLQNTTVPVRYFGIGDRGGEGYYAENVELLPDGVRFTVAINGGTYKFALGIPGRFTVYNALAAISAAYELGVFPEKIAEGLIAIKGVPGRFERVPNDKGLCVIVDYAHTPDSLRNIISAVREFTTGRVITLFGCGGDRDREKRPVMGRIAGELSDFCVVTSDNPRNEAPEAVIKEILPGVAETGTSYIVEPDRHRAIETAINMAKPGDSVILAGKGHEPYQEFENRRRVPFDDKEEALKVLNGGNFFASNA